LRAELLGLMCKLCYRLWFKGAESQCCWPADYRRQVRSSGRMALDGLLGHRWVFHAA